MSDDVEMPRPRWYDIPIVECGEPLVDLRQVRALRVATTADLDAPSVLVRAGVVDRLVTAQARLTGGLRLLVLYAFGSTGIPKAYAESHGAGAATDLTLCTRGGVRLGGDGDPHASESAGGTSLPMEYRLIMHDALRAAGLVGHPTAWGHWSYGDRRWAFAHGARVARYGVVDSPAPR